MNSSTDIWTNYLLLVPLCCILELLLLYWFIWRSAKLFCDSWMKPIGWLTKMLTRYFSSTVITSMRQLCQDVRSTQTFVYQHPDLMSYCLIQWPTTPQLGKTNFGHVWKCFSFWLSHGQASVERGFSVNKQVELDNLGEDTFVAKRIICDHVASVGGLQNIDASDKQLLLAASSARQKYLAYLEDEKKKRERSGRGQKR